MTLAVDRFDLFILIAYLLFVIAFGLWIGRGVKSLSSYLVGDRHLPWWAILGSIVATETSTVTFLSVPGLAFKEDGGDLRFLQLAFGFIAGRFLIVWLLLPLYFRGRIFTAYEVLDQRFGGATKQTASVIFLITRNLGDGLRLFLAAIVLEKVIGIPMPFCVVIIGVATIVYTFFGGMMAVVWNDCLQFLIYMLGGLAAGLVLVTRLPGGMAQLWEFAVAQQKLRLLDFDLSLQDPLTFWAGMIGGMFLTLGTHGTDQMLVQRYLCATSVRAAGRALVVSGFVVLGQFTLFLFLGIGLACFYETFPPDVAFTKVEYVFPTFIVNEMPANVGVIGVVLAAVFAAAMSTLSSSLNSSASSTVNDLVVPLLRKSPSPQQLLWLSRALTVVFGVLQIGVGIGAGGLKELVVHDALAIAGFSAGLLLGLFALGVLTRRVGQRAALSGLVFGLCVLVSLRFIVPQILVGWTLAWPWFPVVGSLSTLAVGLGLSYLVPERAPGSQRSSQ